MLYEVNGVTAYMMPNSPVYREDGITYTFRCKKGTGGEAFRSLQHGNAYAFPFGTGYLDKKRSSVTSDECYDTVTIALCDTQPDGAMISGNPNSAPDTEYVRSTTAMEKPLEMHKNYRTNWNYDLYCYVPTGGQQEEPPAWWETAKDLTDADGLKWAWDKSRPPKDEKGHWELCIQRRKPGVESYYYTATTITETLYTRNKKTAYKKVNNVNVLKAPAETYGLPADAEKWYISSSSIQYQNKYWCIVTEFIYADNGWDEDIYEKDVPQTKQGDLPV